MLRTIKLKHFYGELYNLTPQEELFFKLHDNLYIGEFGALYNKHDEWVIHYDFINNRFWYQYDRVYLIFSRKFGINLQEFDDLCKCVLENHLNCKELTPRCLTDNGFY